MLTGVRPEGQEDAPQLRVEIDRDQGARAGPVDRERQRDAGDLLRQRYANDFIREGRVLRVLLQADAPFRMTPEDVLDLRVRNAQGEMVPFGAFTTVGWTAGPPQVAALQRLSRR